MSDQRLLELHRRWQESGSVEDEAAWLRAAVRQGQLSEDTLAARAWLGDPAGRLALEQAPKEPPDLDPWVRGLAAFDVGPELLGPQVPKRGWGHPLLVRASLVALELASQALGYDPHDSSDTDNESAGLVEARLAVASWVAGGHPPDAGLLEQARFAFESAPSGAPEEALCVCAGLAVAQCIQLGPVVVTARLLATWLSVNLASAQRMVYTPGHVAAVAVCAAERVVGTEALREAIAARLLEWLA